MLYDKVDNYECTTTHKLKDIKDQIDAVLSSLDKDSHPLVNNYTTWYEENNKEKNICFSVASKNSIPIVVSSVLSRDIFKGGVRILNRWYMSKLSRSVPSSHRPSITMIMMAKQQIQYAEMYNADFMFVSREKGKRGLSSWTKEFPDWVTSEHKYKTHNNDQQGQFICWYSETLQELPMVKM